MKRTLALMIVLFLSAGYAVSGDFHLELDGTGVLGDGPDFVLVLPGPVSVDAWVTGGGGLHAFSANFTLSHAGPATWNPYSHATGWTTTPDFNLGGNDWLVQATDFSFVAGLVPPFLHGTVNYTYNGPNGVVAVSVVQPNGVLDSSFNSGPFTGNVHLTFGDLGNATEKSSWGEVKELFR